MHLPTRQDGIENRDKVYSELAGRTGDFVSWIKIYFFRKFLLKARNYPRKLHNGRLAWLNIPV